jgi:hypothetical protein
LHPNATAIAYIWERFVSGSVAVESIPIMDEVDQIQKALAHRAFNPNSESHQKFLSNLNERMSNIKKQYPFLVFE